MAGSFPQVQSPNILKKPNGASKIGLSATGITAQNVELALLEQRWKNVDEWLNQESVFQIRHKRLARKIQEASSGNLPSGICLGNSIMQGSGSTSILETIPWVLAAKLQALTGVDTVSNWSPTNYGVGSATISGCAHYVGDNSDNVDNKVINSQIMANGSVDYAIILSLRNDVSILSVDNYTKVLKATFQQLKNKGIDVIFVTDPPLVDMGNGDILDNQANFGDWYDASINLCADEGVTLVDSWKYFYKLKQSGADLTTYTGDGTHPNDDGYAIIGDLLYKAMKSSSNPLPPYFSGDVEEDKADLVSVYEADAGSVTTTTTITGLTTSSTARQVETGEGTVEAFVLNNGDTVEFKAPAPCQGVLVSMLGGESGSVSANYAFVNIGSAMSQFSGNVRESVHFINIAPTSTLVYNKKGNLRLTSTGITRITGVSFLCERQSAYNRIWLDAVETGTYSTTVFPDAGDCRESSTIGDYVEIDVYGSFLRLEYERFTTSGKFEYSIDGGAATEVDCYLNAAAVAKELLIDLGGAGWHTVKIEVTAKNASATDNKIKIANLTKYLGTPDPKEDYIALNAGESIDMRVKYTKAEIIKTISGAPVAYKGINGYTFTLGGTGTALVRLSKDAAVV
jgi:lysophospholipase L1-like esterase